MYKKLLEVQQKLKAPKSNYNSFGKYNYRSCEDILEGLKPVLEEVKALVLLKDEVVMIGDRYYIKATAYFVDIETGKDISSVAYAREDLDKKGMDLAQVTGSVSSYARKYALNGLFCIDDTKDSDATNTHGKDKDEPHILTEGQVNRVFAIAKSKGYNAESVKKAAIKKYSVTDIKFLSKEQYDEFCKGYEGLPNKEDK